MSNQTTLQITDLNFYGDEIIALKDNVTGEIFTAINSVLRNIGFAERQVRHNREKWLNDSVISKGCQNFVIPDKNGINQDTLCISNRKLPIALTKITITPKMKESQPELTKKLELYQDKCSEVLASVFIDHKTLSGTNLESLTQAITTLTQAMTQMQQDINNLKQETQKKSLPEKKYSRWKANTFNKLRLLTNYANEHSNEELTLSDTIHITINEMQDLYDIELSDYTRDYMLENSLETKPYDLDVINYYKEIKELYTLVIDSTLDKLNLKYEPTITKNIFDELAENL